MNRREYHRRLVEQRIFTAMRRHIEEHGYPPLMRELVPSSGLSHPTSVGKHVRRMVRKGILSQPNGSIWRGVEIA